MDSSDFFGKLTIDAFKHDLIEGSVGVSIILAGIAIVGWLTFYKKWTWLWKEWLTSVDHKKIGIMYLVVTALMLFKGFIDAIMMRAQQVLSVGDAALLPQAVRALAV